jgi:signal peptidase
MSQTNTKKKSDKKQKVLTIIGIVLCLVLLPVLLINLTLIAKSYIHADEVPSVGGKFPMIVLTDSMYPVIESGDLIICNTADADEIRVNDVISFYDPMGNGTSVVTHRVMEIVNEDGEISFRTKGDNNNAEDQVLVPAQSLIGIYQTRIPKVGHVAMFMQTTTGLIVCVVLPIVLLVGYDVLRRRKYEKTQKQDTDALLAELEALRAMKAAQENGNEEK